jgi:NADH-quinone oxidoreductase subunit L
MMAGTLAITGVGLDGIGGFAGFYSKDAILEAAYGRGTHVAQFAWALGIFAALLTSFYSWRLIYLTFFGMPRWDQSEHIRHAVHEAHGHEAHGPDAHGQDGHGDDHHHVSDGTAGYHPHESPLNMLVPLIVLSVGAVAAGAVFAPYFLSEGTGEFWKGALVFDETLLHAAESVPGLVKLAPLLVMLTGLLIATYAYVWNRAFPAAFVRRFGFLHRFLLNKWYFDELYDAIFIRPALWLGRFFWKQIDVGVIDRFGPNGAAWVVSLASRGAVRLQSGYLYSYALVMLVGLVGAISWVIAR